MGEKPKYNRWGEQTNSPEDLPVDAWFPSEAREMGDAPHDDPQTGLAIVMSGIGSLMVIVPTWIIVSSTISGALSPFVIALCSFFWIWGASLLVPYGTLIYYRLRRLSLLNTVHPEGSESLSARDIDYFRVPLHRSWQGPPRIGLFATGNGRATPLTRFARVAGMVLTVLFYVALLAALLVGVLSGFSSR